MQPDVSAAFAPGRGCVTAGRLALGRGAGPMTLVLRTLPDDIAAALDAADPAHLPSLRVRGAAADMAAGLRRYFRAWDFSPPALAGWLADDVAGLARLYGQVSGADTILVRLECIRTDGCTRFHADNVGLRLVSTYRGPGTEWLSPRAVARTPAGQPLPESAIRQMPRGAVALMRGSRDAEPDCPALLHRSPPVAGTGQIRLFLAIDAEPDG